MIIMPQLTSADHITGTERLVSHQYSYLKLHKLAAIHAHAKNWHISWGAVKYHWILDESAQYLGESKRRAK